MTTPLIRQIIKQPMLAPTLPKQVPVELSVEDYVRKYVRLPVLVTPKIDGIRCLIDSRNGVAYSRSFKQIPNHYVQQAAKIFANAWKGGPVIVDGELVRLSVGAEPRLHLSYHTTQSWVLSDSPPWASWQYAMFDCIMGDRLDQPAMFRSGALASLTDNMPNGEKVTEQLCHTYEELFEVEQFFLAAGYEGAMLRHPSSPYKHKARCTLGDGYLLKLVRTLDEVATIVGCEEFMHCTAESMPTETGKLKKYKTTTNTVPSGMLGSFIVNVAQCPETFKVSAGQLSHEQRRELWTNKDKLVGKSIIFRHKPFGQLDVPRHGRFVQFKSKTLNT